MTGQPLRVVITGEPPSTFPRADFGDRIDLQIAHTDEQLRSAVRDANVLYTWQVPDTVPSGTPHLRWIQLNSAGVDHVRDKPVWESNIILTSSSGIHTVPMAEHTFAMLLALTRQIPAIVDAQRRTEWIHASASRQRRPTEIRGRTLGIVGWGKIADGVAHLARAFGMRVIGTRRSVEVPREMPRDGCGAYDNPPWLEPVDLPPDIVYPASQLHEVLAQSDIVLLVLPLTAETERSIGRAEFQTMRRGSILLNIGRGQVVDEEALVDALRAGRIGAAGLDVFQEEPLPRSSPLWSMPNVLISPHIGGVSDRTAERGAALFAANLSRYLQGQPLLNVVERDQGY